MPESSSKSFFQLDGRVVIDIRSVERWLNQAPPKAAQAMPSVWGNQLTFLAGPHACIGFKFALIE